jgi:hypothetical protein
LAFIEHGGYGRSVRTPWLPKSAFQDSLTCINHSDPARTRTCNDCHLIDFVATEHRSEEVPCHFITLNDDGETIEDLEAKGNQSRLENTLKQWMKARIKHMEEEAAKSEATTLSAVQR